MPLPDASPLSPEERALASRLAALDAAAEPSAALDARVLAAARSAGARAAPRRRRWPAAMGLAASLLLAVGVAWQMRPPGSTPSSPSTGLRPGADGDRTPQDEGSEPSAQPIQGKRAVPGAKAVVPPPPVPHPPAEPMDVVVVPSPDAIVLDSPAPESAAVAPSPMALPPAPPPPERALLSAESPAPSQAAAAPSEEAGDQDAAREANAARAEGTGRGDEPEIEVPPATADSPAVRDAWLQRIQGFVDSGDIAAARTSLRAFVQRYPDYALPEDLRALAR